MKTRLKCILINLVADQESVNFEACLLLSLFIEAANEISDPEVYTLIFNNKQNLVKAIKRVNFDCFDSSCDYGVSYEQIKYQIEHLPKL